MISHVKVFIFLLACFCAPAFADDELPQLEKIVKFERRDAEANWREIPREEGETIFAQLQDMSEFRTLEEVFPPGQIHATPSYRGQSFRFVQKSGEIGTIGLDVEWIMPSKKELLLVPKKRRGFLSPILGGWYRSDLSRITSKGLPCEYKMGSLIDHLDLSHVAKIFYGDEKKWERIYAKNSSVVDFPHYIPKGTIITIPKLED